MDRMETATTTLLCCRDLLSRSGDFNGFPYRSVGVHVRPCLANIEVAMRVALWVGKASGVQFILCSMMFSLFLLCAPAPVEAVRVKDVAAFQGDRANQLIGYGLVVGLNGTGDKNKTQFTVNTLANLLDNMGIDVDPNQVKVKNVAGVIVTAKLPPFLKVGSRVDVQVSSIGDAKSLEGGTLLMTPLQGPDNRTYAVAQGPISVGGFAISGASGSSVQKNHPTVGFVSGGAAIEQPVPVQYDHLQEVDLVLRAPDFTTAGKLSQKINQALGGGAATAVDAGTVRIEIPEAYRGKGLVDMIAQVENLEIQPDVAAKIIVNERTGTIVMGENVRISPVAVAHGNLTVQISENPLVSQPAPFSRGGTTAVVPQTDIQVQEEKARVTVVGGGVTIGQVIKGLNAIGATPRDLINILQSIKASGALQADLELI